MEAADSVLRAGNKLDRYELLCPIASGGMATVWLARLRGKRGFEKLFAIKTIRTELVEDPRFEEMFLDEARIASGIQHPNVAQILDLGEQQDVLFIVMEWVDGDSLAKIRRLLAKRGARLPLGIVLRVLADVCGGLHAAHEMRDDKGNPLEIVHRDVSPQNVLVSTAGAVKVIDFGIAKAQNRHQGETRTGVVKGKIHYMAPEQIKKGRTVDRRADVWAIGVCLHELVTGKLPYEGDDDVEVIRKLMTDEGPAVASQVIEPVARILERSIAFDLDARFPTAAGMQRALEAAMKELGESATSEDVAGFLRTELPDLAQQRREVVGKAVEQARERGAPVAASRPRESGTSPVGGRPSELSSDAAGDLDVAFAPTVMRGNEPTLAPPKRKALLEVVADPEDDLEPIRIPKTSRAWLWALLFVVAGGAGAAYAWPAQAELVLHRLGLGADASSLLPSGKTMGSSAAGTRAEATPAAAPSPGVLPSSLTPSAAASAGSGTTVAQPPPPRVMQPWPETPVAPVASHATHATHLGWPQLVPSNAQAASAVAAPPGTWPGPSEPVESRPSLQPGEAPAAPSPSSPPDLSSASTDPSAAPGPAAGDEDPGNPY